MLDQAGVNLTEHERWFVDMLDQMEELEDQDSFTIEEESPHERYWVTDEATKNGSVLLPPPDEKEMNLCGYIGRTLEEQVLSFTSFVSPLSLQPQTGGPANSKKSTHSQTETQKVNSLEEIIDVTSAPNTMHHQVETEKVDPLVDEANPQNMIHRKADIEKVNPLAKIIDEANPENSMYHQVETAKINPFAEIIANDMEDEENDVIHSPISGNVSSDSEEVEIKFFNDVVNNPVSIFSVESNIGRESEELEISISMSTVSLPQQPLEQQQKQQQHNRQPKNQQQKHHVRQQSHRSRPPSRSRPRPPSRLRDQVNRQSNSIKRNQSARTKIRTKSRNAPILGKQLFARNQTNKSHSHSGSHSQSMGRNPSRSMSHSHARSRSISRSNPKTRPASRDPVQNRHRPRSRSASRGRPIHRSISRDYAVNRSIGQGRTRSKSRDSIMDRKREPSDGRIAEEKQTQLQGRNGFEPPNVIVCAGEQVAISNITIPPSFRGNASRNKGRTTPTPKMPSHSEKQTVGQNRTRKHKKSKEDDSSRSTSSSIKAAVHSIFKKLKSHTKKESPKRKKEHNNNTLARNSPKRRIHYSAHKQSHSSTMESKHRRKINGTRTRSDSFESRSRRSESRQGSQRTESRDENTALRVEFRDEKNNFLERSQRTAETRDEKSHSQQRSQYTKVSFQDDYRPPLTKSYSHNMNMPVEQTTKSILKPGQFEVISAPRHATGTRSAKYQDDRLGSSVCRIEKAGNDTWRQKLFPFIKST